MLCSSICKCVYLCITILDIVIFPECNFSVIFSFLFPRWGCASVPGGVAVSHSTIYLCRLVVTAAPLVFQWEENFTIMDDSDQDFVDLASKLLKRVRKKPAEPRPPRRAEHQSASSQASAGDKRRRNNKKDGDSRPKFTGTQSVRSGTGCDSGDAGSVGVPSGARAEKVLTAEDKVLLRMQQFKRASPPRMVHRDAALPTSHENDRTPNPAPQRQGDRTCAI